MRPTYSRGSFYYATSSTSDALNSFGSGPAGCQRSLINVWKNNRSNTFMRFVYSGHS